MTNLHRHTFTLTSNPWTLSDKLKAKTIILMICGEISNEVLVRWALQLSNSNLNPNIINIDYQSSMFTTVHKDDADEMTIMTLLLNLKDTNQYCHRECQKCVYTCFSTIYWCIQLVWEVLSKTRTNQQTAEHHCVEA